MVKRYTMPEPSDGRGRAPQPEGAPFLDVMLYCEYVLATDYDAMDNAATALGIHVQYCEARIASLAAALQVLAGMCAYREDEPLWGDAMRMARAALAPESPKRG